MNDHDTMTDDQLDDYLAQLGWYARAGVTTPEWPLSLAGAVELLRKGGQYDIDPDCLTDLAARGLLPIPSDGRWAVRDIIEAAGFLESRRQWAACPSIHDAKKHPTRVLLEQHGAEAVLSQGMRPDLRYLLVLMTRSDNGEMREKLFSGICAELASTHDVRV